MRGAALFHELLCKFVCYVAEGENAPWCSQSSSRLQSAVGSVMQGAGKRWCKSDLVSVGGGRGRFLEQCPDSSWRRESWASYKGSALGIWQGLVFDVCSLWSRSGL